MTIPVVPMLVVPPVLRRVGICEVGKETLVVKAAVYVVFKAVALVSALTVPPVDSPVHWKMDKQFGQNDLHILN
jgi:hypothetical protein